jgi:hypothetical protein
VTSANASRLLVTYSLARGHRQSKKNSYQHDKRNAVVKHANDTQDKILLDIRLPLL